MTDEHFMHKSVGILAGLILLIGGGCFLFKSWNFHYISCVLNPDSTFDVMNVIHVMNDTEMYHS